MRWSRVLRRQRKLSPLQATRKVVVFGGGSFGTAMGVALAKQKPSLEVVLLLRDQGLCDDINTQHCNTRYLKVRPHACIRSCLHTPMQGRSRVRMPCRYVHPYCTLTHTYTHTHTLSLTQDTWRMT